MQTSVKTDRICTGAKLNPLPAGIGGSFEPAAPVLLTKALTNYTNGLLAESKKTVYNCNTRKRNTKVYRGIAMVETTWTIIANRPT